MTQPQSSAMESGVDRDLAVLERKLATLVTYTRALRAANETLRHDLAAAHEGNRALAERVAAATQRIDALLARLPESAQ
jgi:cell division protein ZapB